MQGSIKLKRSLPHWRIHSIPANSKLLLGITMKKFTSFLGGTLIAVSSLLTFNLHAESASDGQIYQLLDKSGTTRMIEGLPLQMQAMGQQIGLTAKDPKEHQDFMSLFVGTINTDQMMRQMLDSVKSNMSSDDIQGVLDWLNSDVGERIVSAELKSAEPEFQQALMLYIAELQTSHPSNERKKVIMDFVEKSNMVDQGMNMVANMMKNMFAAVKANEPDNKELAANLDNQLAFMVDSMRPAFEQQMVLTSYYLYQDISNEDIAKYSQFFEQPTGQKYLTVMYEALSDTMSTWGTSMITELMAQHDKLEANAE